MRILIVQLRPDQQFESGSALNAWDAAFSEGLPSALEILREKEPGAIILHVGDMADDSGHSAVVALGRLLDQSSRTRVIATGSGRNEAIQNLLAHGAFDFITLPDETHVLAYAVDRALRIASFDRMPPTPAKRRRLMEVLPGFFTADPVTRRVARRIERMNGHDPRLMLQGEPGTGRATLARLVATGRRNDQYAGVAEPVRFMCHPGVTTAEIQDLFEPHRVSPNRLSLPSIGRRPATLIVESIDELGLDAQSAFARRLLDPALQPGDRSNLRIIATATAQLGQRIAQSQFRRELYDLVAEVHLCLPPLRQRGSDSVELVEHYLSVFSTEFNRPRPELSLLALESIREHEWPGNVSELRNAARQAVLTGASGIVEPADLGLTLQSTTRLMSLREARETAERDVVQRAMKRVNGNIARASEMLGISRPTLYDLLNKLNMR